MSDIDRLALTPHAGLNARRVRRVTLEAAAVSVEAAIKRTKNEHPAEGERPSAPAPSAVVDEDVPFGYRQAIACLACVDGYVAPQLLADGSDVVACPLCHGEGALFVDVRRLRQLKPRRPS